MRLMRSTRDWEKSLLFVLLSLLPSVILKSPKSVRLVLWVIFLYNNFLIFLINICLSIHCYFIVSEGAYKSNTGFVIIYSVREEVLFASLKQHNLCLSWQDYHLSIPEIPEIVLIGEIYMCLLQNGEGRIQWFTIVNY